MSVILSPPDVIGVELTQQKQVVGDFQKPFMRSGRNFQTSEEIGVEEGSSTPVERNKFFSICSTHGVE